MQLLDAGVLKSYSAISTYCSSESSALIFFEVTIL